MDNNELRERLDKVTKLGSKDQIVDFAALITSTHIVTGADLEEVLNTAVDMVRESIESMKENGKLDAMKELNAAINKLFGGNKDE